MSTRSQVSEEKLDISYHDIGTKKDNLPKKLFNESLNYTSKLSDGYRTLSKRQDNEGFLTSRKSRVSIQDPNYSDNPIEKSFQSVKESKVKRYVAKD